MKKSPRWRLPLIVGLALLAGIAIGFVVGRAMLEAKWSNPLGVVSPADYKRSSEAKDADPTPPAGAKRLAILPFVRMRQEAAKLTKGEPLEVTLTSFGNGETTGELHLMMRNHAACKITSYSGIAYAYDARGRPAKANAAGESYLAFRSNATEDKDIGIEPNGGKHIHAQVLKHTDIASLGVAHVDAYACADGTKWARQ
ncbi:MAG TPA: hypothetical protein PLR99_06860 [Polyangiaceae bacterium]|nr:hypothetical protein [Polyangiaceae bacterium]